MLHSMGSQNMGHDWGAEQQQQLCIGFKWAGWKYTSLMRSFPSFEPVHCSLSGSNYCFLTYIQISQEVGMVVWYSYLFNNFLVCRDPHSQRLYSSQWIKIRFFFWNFLAFFNDTTDDCNLISGSSAFSKSSLYTWKLSVDILLKCVLKDFEYCIVSMWNV